MTALSPDWFVTEQAPQNRWEHAPERRWDPRIVYPHLYNENLREPPWFTETISNGPRAAWQTPGAGDSFHRSESIGVSGDDRWRYVAPDWAPDYRVTELVNEARRSAKHQASWFSPRVDEYDIYGRRLPPEVGSAQRMMAEVGGDAWFERTVNTSVVCSRANCTGSSTLYAFDPATEEANHCYLQIHVHPTDFDADWSEERVRFRVNGYTVKAQCDPMARGCNATAWRPLISCLRDMSVDHIINNTNGAMVVEGKISPMVDECPYEGNLLSSVAAVTCMVRPRRAPPEVQNLAGSQVTLMPEWTTSAPVRCREPGCNASTDLWVDPNYATQGGACLLTWTLNQTDFDDASSEFLEYVNLGTLSGSINMRNNIPEMPSLNPCNAEYAHPDPDPARTPLTLIKGLNISGAILRHGNAGIITFRAKISNMVDECDSEGYLFDSRVTVTCRPP
jgi:hypothetical protein